MSETFPPPSMGSRGPVPETITRDTESLESGHTRTEEGPLPESTGVVPPHVHVFVGTQRHLCRGPDTLLTKGRSPSSLQNSRVPWWVDDPRYLGSLRTTDARTFRGPDPITTKGGANFP